MLLIIVLDPPGFSCLLCVPLWFLVSGGSTVHPQQWPRTDWTEQRLNTTLQRFPKQKGGCSRVPSFLRTGLRNESHSHRSSLITGRWHSPRKHLVWLYNNLGDSNEVKIRASTEPRTCPDRQGDAQNPYSHSHPPPVLLALLITGPCLPACQAQKGTMTTFSVTITPQPPVRGSSSRQKAPPGCTRCIT